MSNLNIKRKLELGIAAYIESLKQGRSPLKSYNVHQASQADDRKLPAIMVEASGGEEAFPFGPKNVTLTVYVSTQLDDNDSEELPSTAQRRKVRLKHDDALDQLNEALDGTGAVEGIQTLLNHGAASRPVEDFYFYDITKQDEAHAFADRCFVDSLTFTCTVEANDCLALPAVTCDNTRITCDNG